MNPRNFIPALPESAPFTPEQRAYLNGFLAGMFSRVPATATPAPTGQAKPATPLTIVFGSQTGTAETLAKRIAKEAGKRGLVPTIHDLASYPVAQLAAERALLVITSTYGDGEPPDNARGWRKRVLRSARWATRTTRSSANSAGRWTRPSNGSARNASTRGWIAMSITRPRFKPGSRER